MAEKETKDATGIGSNISQILEVVHVVVIRAVDPRFAIYHLTWPVPVGALIGK